MDVFGNLKDKKNFNFIFTLIFDVGMTSSTCNRLISEISCSCFNWSYIEKENYMGDQKMLQRRSWGEDLWGFPETIKCKHGLIKQVEGISG